MIHILTWFCGICFFKLVNESGVVKAGAGVTFKGLKLLEEVVDIHAGKGKLQGLEDALHSLQVSCAVMEVVQSLEPVLHLS